MEWALLAPVYRWKLQRLVQGRTGREPRTVEGQGGSMEPLEPSQLASLQDQTGLQEARDQEGKCFVPKTTSCGGQVSGSG